MLWGSRFSTSLYEEALDFTSSLPFDIHLFENDITCSKAHATMLSEQSIVSKEELDIILKGLDEILNDFLSGSWKPDPHAFEDVHSAIEAKLTEKIGPIAGKLHSGRSRNDQVVTDLHLWLKERSTNITTSIRMVQKTLLLIAEDHTETIMPGYTHLQRAQPVSLAFHMLAYIEMLKRSTDRFSFVYNEADYCPLGSGALAGSTLPLNRKRTAELLGFSRGFCENALDAVSSRDSSLDFLNACVICMSQLSRLCEELILWNTTEWHFITIGDAFTTGSSLMPQKKNPDIAELIRGKTGRIYGNYIALATVIKGLPLSYNRDLQEDKEPLIDSYFTLYNSLGILDKMLQTISIDRDRFAEELNGDFCFATDLADWLVLKGISFRESHKIVGQVVKCAETCGVKLHRLPLPECQKIHPIFDNSVYSLFKASDSLKRKKTSGSPNPEDVNRQLHKWKKDLF
ncbi:MAG: argininosuccinate lyase [Chitinispirillia bacterium]|jgi:argininosuccinate lyase